MNSGSIERYIPTFTPPVRRTFLVITAILRSALGFAHHMRSRFVIRFSLRVMMIVVLVVGSGLGWVVQRARIQREAVAGVKRAGGSAWYDWQWKGGRPDRNSLDVIPTPEQPRRYMMQFELNHWLDQYNASQTSSKSWRMPDLGAEYFGNVVLISLGPHGIDADLGPIGSLDRLEILDLNSSAVTDAGMVHLKGLSNLQILYLNDTHIGDGGMAYLASLTSLKSLDLSNTEITDAGLVQLAGLSGLEELYVGNTRVTDAGLAHLKNMTALGKLDLEGTQISDTGLAHLKELTYLHMLDLDRTRISDEGLVHLEELTRLRWLSLGNTQVDDAGMEHLTKFRKDLYTLYLSGTRVGDAGMVDLGVDPVSGNPSSRRHAGGQFWDALPR